MHVIPRETFEKAVLGQDADVLRKIGVINAARLQVEHLGREQAAETDRPRRADDDFSELFALDVIENLEERREAELLQFVFRAIRIRRSAGSSSIGMSSICESLREVTTISSSPAAAPLARHFANGGGDAVDVFKRIGEPGALCDFKLRRDLRR